MVNTAKINLEQWKDWLRFRWRLWVNQCWSTQAQKFLDDWRQGSCCAFCILFWISYSEKYIWWHPFMSVRTLTLFLPLLCCCPLSELLFPPNLPLKGVPVCRQSFLKLLGISASRLVRTRNSFKGVDGRRWGFLTWLNVSHYYLELIDCQSLTNWFTVNLFTPRFSGKPLSWSCCLYHSFPGKNLLEHRRDSTTWDLWMQLLVFKQ